MGACVRRPGPRYPTGRYDGRPARPQTNGAICLLDSQIKTLRARQYGPHTPLRAVLAPGGRHSIGAGAAAARQSDERALPATR
jgi:hypothetical protein